MSDPRESVSIGDDGTLDTVVDYDGKFGRTLVRFDSEHRFSFDNDSAFLDAVAEEVEDVAFMRCGREEKWRTSEEVS
jgi:hypothetical protein